MQLKVHMITIEDLMPTNHFLRRLEEALDLTFVYEESASSRGEDIDAACGMLAGKSSPVQGGV